MYTVEWWIHSNGTLIHVCGASVHLKNYIKSGKKNIQIPEILIDNFVFSDAAVTWDWSSDNGQASGCVSTAGVHRCA